MMKKFKQTLIDWIFFSLMLLASGVFLALLFFLLGVVSLIFPGTFEFYP